VLAWKALEVSGAAAQSVVQQPEGGSLPNRRLSHSSPSKFPGELAQRLADLCRSISFHNAKVPYQSNVTGTWAKTAQLR